MYIVWVFVVGGRAQTHRYEDLGTYVRTYLRS